MYQHRCYIVAFLCEEEAASIRGTRPNLESWRSSLPFVRFVSSKCKDVQHLYGLGYAIYPLCFFYIVGIDVDRLY